LQQKRWVFSFNNIRHLFPIHVKILLSHFHISKSVHYVHFKLFMFYKLKCESYYFITFIFLFLQNNELTLVLIDQLKNIMKTFILKKPIEPLSKVFHFTYGLFS